MEARHAETVAVATCTQNVKSNRGQDGKSQVITGKAMAKKRKPSTVKKPPPVRIKPPADLDAQEQAVWDELVKETPWLTRYDAVNLHMYCCALARYRRDPSGCSNALHNRLKSLGSKLGFDPGSRRNFNLEARKLPPPRTANSHFFDDAPETPEQRRSRLIAEEFFPPAQPDPPDDEEEQ